MTIPASIRRAGPFGGNDATTEFPFAFRIFAKADLQVTLTDPLGVESTLLLDSDYSVTISNDPEAPGGAVTYPITGAPLPTGYRLTISGRLPYSQTADIQNQGGFFPDVVEAALDRLAVQTQQLAERADRAVQVPVSSDTTPEQLIDQLVQASADAQAAAGNAQASQTAAATSETNAAASASEALSSKNAAATSETNAATSASQALASQNAAATSEDNAAGSASTAASAASSASASKDAAALSATSAANSATNAAASETNAANSAASASNSADRAEAVPANAPWMSLPLGMEFSLVAGAPTPPKNDSQFRYILLTAGLAGAGGYNEGVLINETVNGSDPTITATAVVSLAGSPMDGKTINLINTSRTFLRPGPTAGPIVDSQNAQHSHTGSTNSAGAHTHGIYIPSGSGAVYSGIAGANGEALSVKASNSTTQATTTSSGAHSHTLSISNSGGDEARPRYIPRVYLMRIL